MNALNYPKTAYELVIMFVIATFLYCLEKYVWNPEVKN